MPERALPLILAVDDTEANLDILVETLGDEYDIAVALDGEAALDLAGDTPPDLILLDIMMPGMDGYQVCEALSRSLLTRNVPVIFLTALTDERDEARGLALGAVDYITKPFSPALVKARVRNHIELKRHRDRLEELVQERTWELSMTQEAAMESLGTLAECRDPETGGHIQRTRNYVRMIAAALARAPKHAGVLNDTEVFNLHRSAPLHDIGKVGIPDSILLKPGKLTPEEFAVMKTHTLLGAKAIAAAEKRLGANSFLRHAHEIALSHHEKWDGSGYPNGLAGEDIPLAGRIMAVADVYDALISHRVYKASMPHSRAVSIIQEGSGTAFDPEIVAVFLELAEEFRAVALENADYDEERETLKQ
ncbi:MAG TPA: response regulator [Candidatus Hydrogenedentes bacterium]|nr:response regulator [Candidatus Hydrogenedentota bacterium]